MAQVQGSVGGGWAAVADLHDGSVHAWLGPIPPVRWLVAFVAGSQHAARLQSTTGCAAVRDGAEPGAAPSQEVVWAPLVVAGVALVVGRDQGGIRAKQRHRIAALARIADAWVGALARHRRALRPPGHAPGVKPAHRWAHHPHQRFRGPGDAARPGKPRGVGDLRRPDRTRQGGEPRQVPRLGPVGDQLFAG